MHSVISFDKVKNLDMFIDKLGDYGFRVEHRSHVVLEDHSELSILEIRRGDVLKAYIIVHYITQYYRAVISGNHVDDKTFLEKLLEIKYSGEKWSIPVNPVYVILFDRDVVNVLDNYSDTYPVENGEQLVKQYREKNPGYESIPRIVIARLIET